MHLNHSDGNTRKDRAKICDQSGEANVSSDSWQMERSLSPSQKRGPPGPGGCGLTC